MHPPTARLSTIGALAVVCPVLTVALAARVLTGLGVEVWTIDHLIGLIVMVLGVLVGVWLSAWLSISALCVAAAAFGARLRRLERLLASHGPRALRRLVATAIGVGLTATIAPALADDGIPTPDPILAELAWKAPEQTAFAAPGTTVVEKVTVDQGGTVLQEGPNAQPVIVVQPGDSLWRIAAAHLPPGVSAERISAEWPRWYALNKDLIGANPNLLHPGQELMGPAVPAPFPTTQSPPVP